MKKLYTALVAFIILSDSFVPIETSAQCLCSGGTAPSVISYNAVLNPTNASSSTISFPKFDPSIGSLGCVSFVDTISGITTTHVWNLASTKTKYKFALSVANNLSGPGGISVDEDYSKNYGPDSLNAKGNSPGDSITYGPDNLFTNVKDSTNTTNTASFLGTVGTVNFVYSLNGGLISLIGSLNYGDQIITNYWGAFRLDYYWCPAGLLATGVINFSAVRKGKYVEVEWMTQNEQLNSNYQVESSSDGTHFNPIKDLPSRTGLGDSTLYQYLYQLGASQGGKLYFRIKKLDPQGLATYTGVKIVNLDATSVSGYQVYPNPVTNLVVMEFDDMQTGNYVMSLLNTTGQIIQQKTVTLAGSSQIRMELSSKPAPGIYYLQTKDRTRNQQYISKLFIQ